MLSLNQYLETFAPKKVLCINDRIYDVTHYMHEHPGGDSILEGSLYSDATIEFESMHHSQVAYRKLADLYICNVDYTLVRRDEEKDYVYGKKKDGESNEENEEEFDEELDEEDDEEQDEELDEELDEEQDEEQDEEETIDV